MINVVLVISVTSSERCGQGKVRTGVGRDCAAYSAGADVSCAVASVSCCNAKVGHRETQSRVVVVESCLPVVPHVACENAPVRREVDFEESRHPVLLVVLTGEVLEFQTCRQGRGPFVEHVGHENVGHADVAARHRVGLVIFLRQVQ